MLNNRMRRALTAIVNYQRATGGVSPAGSEIATAMGMTSKGRVSQILSELERAGYIRRISGRSRSIEVLRTGDTTIPIFDADTHQIRGYVS